MIWIVFLIIGVVVLSVLVGGGINFAFLKILAIFVVGMIVLMALKKLWDNFKGK